jgi:hypothetical protein
VGSGSATHYLPTVWGFVFKKKADRRGDEVNFPYIGDAWTFVAIEP